MARRTLTEADVDAWFDYARHITVLSGRPPLPTQPATVLPPRLARTPPPSPPIPARKLPLPPVAVGERPSGIDDGSWTRFRTGKLRPDRTLDLHGHTAQRAFHALQSFLHQAQAQRLRCVEIITGRGSAEAGGVLRREVPLWLNLPALHPYVLAMAHPHAANTGSIRILLRRIRDQT